MRETAYNTEYCTLVESMSAFYYVVFYLVLICNITICLSYYQRFNRLSRLQPDHTNTVLCIRLQCSRIHVMQAQ